MLTTTTSYHYHSSQCNNFRGEDQDDKEWNALVWLLRFTGCRIAEALILRWEDVDFANSEITIRGKRKGVGGKSGQMQVRVTPLWKPLVPVLNELKEMADDEAVHLLNSIGGLGKKPEFDQIGQQGDILRTGRWATNMETTFKKILIRNGIECWPQPFHALRRYRINELERQQGIRTIDVRDWTGNSEATAQGYYSQSTREDRQAAVEMSSDTPPSRGEAAGSQDDGDSVEVLCLSKRHQTASDQVAENELLQELAEIGCSEAICDDLDGTKVLPLGLEPRTH